MVDVTISQGMTRPFSLKSLAAVMAIVFACFDWYRFRRTRLPMSDRMLADIGIKRSDLYKASTASEYISRNGAW